MNAGSTYYNMLWTVVVITALKTQMVTFAIKRINFGPVHLIGIFDQCITFSFCEDMHQVF